MDSARKIYVRSPFGQLPTTVNQGLQDVDPKEAKRQRDREHFARMSSDQKEERNMKKREISDDKWEATNKKRREMSDERREELNRKHRDQYKMKKGREDNKENVPSNDQDDVNGGLPIHSSDVEVGEHNDKHDEMHDWLHTNHLYGPPISESCDLSNQIPGSGDNGEIVHLIDTTPQDTPVVDPKERRRLQARALRVADSRTEGSK